MSRMKEKSETRDIYLTATLLYNIKTILKDCTYPQYFPNRLWTCDYNTAIRIKSTRVCACVCMNWYKDAEDSPNDLCVLLSCYYGSFTFFAAVRTATLGLLKKFAE